MPSDLREDEQVVFGVVDEGVFGAVAGEVAPVLLGIEPHGLLGPEAGHHVLLAAHQVRQFVGVAPAGTKAGIHRVLAAGVGQPGAPPPEHAGADSVLVMAVMGILTAPESPGIPQPPPAALLSSPPAAAISPPPSQQVDVHGVSGLIGPVAMKVYGTSVIR